MQVAAAPAALLKTVSLPLTNVFMVPSPDQYVFCTEEGSSLLRRAPPSPMPACCKTRRKAKTAIGVEEPVPAPRRSKGKTQVKDSALDSASRAEEPADPAAKAYKRCDKPKPPVPAGPDSWVPFLQEFVGGTGVLAGVLQHEEQQQPVQRRKARGSTAPRMSRTRRGALKPENAAAGAIITDAGGTNGARSAAVQASGAISDGVCKAAMPRRCGGKATTARSRNMLAAQGELVATACAAEVQDGTRLGPNLRFEDNEEVGLSAQVLPWCKYRKRIPPSLHPSILIPLRFYLEHENKASLVPYCFPAPHDCLLEVAGGPDPTCCATARLTIQTAALRQCAADIGGTLTSAGTGTCVRRTVAASCLRRCTKPRALGMCFRW